MSLAIEVSKVKAVLLADGWHFVEAKSFTIDAYEFTAGINTHGDFIVLLGGGVSEGVVSTGAMWEEKGVTNQPVIVACPLTSILAVRLK